MQLKSDSPQRPVWFSRRTACYVAGTLALTVALSGCGNVAYTYRALSATARIEEARNVGAEHSATYEYTLAQEHLRKAQTEAAEADYGDAYELAGLAGDYAQRAIDKAQHGNVNEPTKPAPPDDTGNPGHTSLSVSAGGQK